MDSGREHDHEQHRDELAEAVEQVVVVPRRAEPRELGPHPPHRHEECREGQEAVQGRVGMQAIGERCDRGCETEVEEELEPGALSIGDVEVAHRRRTDQTSLRHVRTLPAPGSSYAHTSLNRATACCRSCLGSIGVTLTKSVQMEGDGRPVSAPCAAPEDRRANVPARPRRRLA